MILCEMNYDDDKSLLIFAILRDFQTNTPFHKFILNMRLLLKFPTVLSTLLTVNQGSVAGEVQQARFVEHCEMQLSF